MQKSTPASAAACCSTVFPSRRQREGLYCRIVHSRASQESHKLELHTNLAEELLFCTHVQYSSFTGITQMGASQESHRHQLHKNHTDSSFTIQSLEEGISHTLPLALNPRMYGIQYGCQADPFGAMGLHHPFHKHLAQYGTLHMISSILLQYFFCSPILLGPSDLQCSTLNPCDLCGL